MAIVTVGIDLAKNVFAVYRVDATGKPALVRPSVARFKSLLQCQKRQKTAQNIHKQLQNL